MISGIIAGTGSYLPERVLTNFDLEKLVDTSDEWIKTRTGISERRIAGDGQATSDLAIQAAGYALESARIAPSDVDLIVCSTISPDLPFPATACFIQAGLGASRAFGFDINAACSGFVYALSVANQYIKAGAAKNVLVVGAETLSKIIDWTDRNTCVLFGDGAGAVILQAHSGNGRGIIDIQLYTDGKLSEMIHMPAGGSRNPASQETVQQRQHYLKMKGNETFKIAVRNLSESALNILKRNNLTIADISLFIPHQANHRIIQAVGDTLEIPASKVYSTMEIYGNTSAASIPIALDKAVREGRLKPGDLVLFSAFGGGITWAACLVRW